MWNFMSINFCIIFSNLLIEIANAGVPYITEKPDFLPSCQIKKPEFVKCSTNSIQKLFDYLIENDGIEGLDNLPKFDPFSVSKISVKDAGTSAINLNIDLTKVIIHGFSKLKIAESRVSPKDYSWNTKIFIPYMSFVGDYQVKGKILLINMNGRGNLSLIIDNLDIDLYTKTRLYEKGGFTFYNVTKTRADYKLTKLKARLDNLFNGQKELEESTNTFFNENWETLNEAFKPIIQKTISDILLNYLQTVFHFIPANYFVSDIPTPKELYGE